MGIWLKGLENASSETADLFCGNFRSPNKANCAAGFDAPMEPNTSRDVSVVTTGAMWDAFGISYNIGGRVTYFNIFDSDWKLNIEGAGNAAYQYLTITRNYGEYKIIMADWGLCIEDISEDKPALAVNGVSKRYYLLYMEGGYMKAEPSDEPRRNQ